MTSRLTHDSVRTFMCRELEINADAYGGAVDVPIKLASVALDYFDVGDPRVDEIANQEDALIWEIAQEFSEGK